MQWTTLEVARLRELARTMPVVDIVAMMPGRSYDSVVDAASRYGISLRTPRGLVYCHDCGEFRTKTPCPVCKERKALETERAKQSATGRIPQRYRAIHMRNAQGSRVDPVPPVPDYKGEHCEVRRQCIAREAVQAANMKRERRAMQRRRERMAKKATK